MEAVRVGIVGAGPSGLAALRAFESARANGAAVPTTILCLEKQDDWGGLWNYSWRTGVDEYGEAQHGSMYRYLWSNGPKECLEFADYSFDEHFGRPLPSFPPREVLFDYIQGRVEKAGVRKNIRFSSVVRWVTFDEARQTFTVVVHDQKADRTYEEVFDYLIVASGHFSTPNSPEYPGFPSFNGRILHAHDFRDAREFAGKTVLLVGSSYSAEDIGSQCWKYGAAKVVLSYRSAPTGFAWPSNWCEVPGLARVEGSTAHFVDGTSHEVDAIILCTGYQHYFPFLPDSLRLKTTNRLALPGCYKGVAWAGCGRLFYVGMQDQWFSFNMFDAQAWWARDVVLGRISLPDEEAMRADAEERMARELSGTGAKFAIRYQGDYVKELIAETDYPSFDVDAACQAFLEWKQNKAESIMGFRDRTHRSVITGTAAALHHTPWKDALDDSLKAFLE